MYAIFANSSLVFLVDIGRRNIVICTTSIISGNRMMDAAVEKGTFEKEVPLASTAAAE